MFLHSSYRYLALIRPRAKLKAVSWNPILRPAVCIRHIADSATEQSYSRAKFLKIMIYCTRNPNVGPGRKSQNLWIICQSFQNCMPNMTKSIDDKCKITK